MQHHALSPTIRQSSDILDHDTPSRSFDLVTGRQAPHHPCSPTDANLSITVNNESPPFCFLRQSVVSNTHPCGSSELMRQSCVYMFRSITVVSLLTYASHATGRMLQALLLGHRVLDAWMPGSRMICRLRPTPSAWTNGHDTGRCSIHARCLHGSRSVLGLPELHLHT